MKNKDILKEIHFFDILNSMADGIYITNAKGITLWLNNASEKIIGKPRSELIGRSVYQLEKEGIFSPSVTRLTLEKKKMVSTVQTCNNGRKYLVSGHLIKNEEGAIDLVVAHSRDITEIVRASSQLEEIEALLQKYSQEIRKLKLNRHEHPSTPIFIGHSKASKELMALCEQVAKVDTTILITGETGVGKNVIAQYIHNLSYRHQLPFVHINCAAIPESLLESELFGYKKGAFTGADGTGKKGLVEAAHRGTLFLDEISELPLHLQPKLLQLLQDKTYMPIGSTRLHRADVRIIAATNRNLGEMVQEGRFRSDLYYRLNILPVHIPPLRQRKEDIIPLLHHFLKKYNQKYGLRRTFAPEALDALVDYDWPGNIRELENLVERLVITAQNDEIMVDDLHGKINTVLVSSSVSLGKGETLPDKLARIEKEIIQQVLRRHRSTRKAARVLGISQSALMRRIKKYHINHLKKPWTPYPRNFASAYSQKRDGP
ncbi:RNA polymerase subunit sigma-54 [Caldalkalibacillus thermarum]|uniref:sigma-54 interaction domain-containing protein n=1 Tax=Caldalkalibacillus thermarum TaxID=296745 RepID=UPI00199F537A|nr:sigma 54-interacting transcriptional regulator [Caldalkalibacillus thermarum]GGK35365.1 RNA polymerase subunit sigma-54 [Caldalkalibacillus thermarum]